MSENLQRISGTEMEWPVSVRLVGSAQYQQMGDEYAHLVNPQYTPEELIAQSQMLSNGARFYKDVGDKVEYATPESSSFEQTVLSELAGERVMAHALSGVVHNEDISEKIEKAVLMKRVIDDDRSGWGYHVNLSASRQRIPAGIEHGTGLLLTHLSTSLAMLGGGAVFENKYGTAKKLSYSLGQKVLSMTGDYIKGTTGTWKPLVSLRDEPHAKKEEYIRAHIVGTDPHISPRATWMMLGTSSLMLSACEQGRADAIALTGGEHPGMDVAKQVSQDLTFKKKFELEDGRHMTAIEIQAALIDLAEKIDRTDEETRVLEEWKRDVADLECDPMLLSDRSDAIAKLKIIRHAAGGSEELDERSKLIDLSFSTIMWIDKKNQKLSNRDAEKVIAQSQAAKLRKTLFGSFAFPEERIKDAMLSPPTDSRAYIRGTLIAQNALRGADWTWASTHDGERIDLSDPYKNYDDKYGIQKPITNR